MELEATPSPEVPDTGRSRKLWSQTTRTPLPWRPPSLPQPLSPHLLPTLLLPPQPPGEPYRVLVGG